MDIVRIVVGVILVAVLAFVLAALVTLVVESAMTLEVGLGAFVLLAAILLGVGRGMQSRHRTETPYW